MSKRFGKNDLIFLSILLIIVVLACIYFYFGNAQKGDFVQITVDGKVYGTYDLSMPQEILILNEAGKQTNVLLIENGRAKMIEADCPDKLCMHQNAIYISGANIVCLPNKVVAMVVGTTEDDELDAIAQ